VFKELWAANECVSLRDPSMRIARAQFSSVNRREKLSELLAAENLQRFNF
jgi:hypothetical protein